MCVPACPCPICKSLTQGLVLCTTDGFELVYLILRPQTVLIFGYAFVRFPIPTRINSSACSRLWLRVKAL